MRARNGRLARRAPAGGGIDQQAHDERRPGGAIDQQAPSETRGGHVIFAAPFATRSPGPATQTMPVRYENATNVNRNAADTIHMSGLTSRQWPCVTFTTT